MRRALPTRPGLKGLKGLATLCWCSLRAPCNAGGGVAGTLDGVASALLDPDKRCTSCIARRNKFGDVSRGEREAGDACAACGGVAACAGVLTSSGDPMIDTASRMCRGCVLLMLDERRSILAELLNIASSCDNRNAGVVPMTTGTMPSRISCVGSVLKPIYNRTQLSGMGHTRAVQ